MPAWSMAGFSRKRIRDLDAGQLDLDEVYDSPDRDLHQGY
jgi:hypothetical protein